MGAKGIHRGVHAGAVEQVGLSPQRHRMRRHVWQSHIVADKWWYCLTHKTVEPNGGCPNKNRLGPYPDEATAGRALDIVRERNEQWDSEDREWENGLPPG